MGPIALFDKSFLQSLSEDESVWFDNFFIPNVCPLFYVETLADLEKSVRDGRTPEQEVGVIAAKFPDTSGTPNAFHAALAASDLMGDPVPMTGQIIVAGGRSVRTGSTTGVVFEPSHEAKAFSRWQEGEFLEIERSFARAWRESLTSLDLAEIAETLGSIGIGSGPCKSLDDAKSQAERAVASEDNSVACMKLSLLFLRGTSKLDKLIWDRWIAAGCPPLPDYAPYAAYVLTVQVFFQLALAAGHISSGRFSNRVDIAYLFYLPFCMVFISSDRLHARCAPLFLRAGQGFVWGQDLKADLRRLNERYGNLPEKLKERGITSFAHSPPRQGDFLVSSLWDKHLPTWRDKQYATPQVPRKDPGLVAAVHRIADAPDLRPEEAGFGRIDADAVIVKRRVRKKKGSWWQVPKNLEA